MENKMNTTTIDKKSIFSEFINEFMTSDIFRFYRLIFFISVFIVCTLTIYIMSKIYIKIKSSNSNNRSRMKFSNIHGQYSANKCCLLLYFSKTLILKAINKNQSTTKSNSFFESSHITPSRHIFEIKSQDSPSLLSVSRNSKNQIQSIERVNSVNSNIDNKSNSNLSNNEPVDKFARISKTFFKNNNCGRLSPLRQKRHSISSFQIEAELSSKNKKRSIKKSINSSSELSVASVKSFHHLNIPTILITDTNSMCTSIVDVNSSDTNLNNVKYITPLDE